MWCNSMKSWPVKKKIYFVMEYVNGGELFDKGHKDLKPKILLLDGHGKMKIAYIGLSALPDQARKDGLLHTACGTPTYVAPEVILNSSYDGAKVDLWSCGVILCVLLTGYFPFNDSNLKHVKKNNKNKKRKVNKNIICGNHMLGGDHFNYTKISCHNTNKKPMQRREECSNSNTCPLALVIPHPANKTVSNNGIYMSASLVSSPSPNETKVLDPNEPEFTPTSPSLCTAFSPHPMFPLGIPPPYMVDTHYNYGPGFEMLFGRSLPDLNGGKVERQIPSLVRSKVTSSLLMPQPCMAAQHPRHVPHTADLLRYLDKGERAASEEVPSSRPRQVSTLDLNRVFARFEEAGSPGQGDGGHSYWFLLTVPFAMRSEQLVVCQSGGISHTVPVI
eukprot:Gb_23246 [translate_table: standard]